MPIYRRLGHMLQHDSQCTLCGKRYGRLFVLEEHSDPTYLKGIPNLFCWNCLNTHEWHWIFSTPQVELLTAVNYQWTENLTKNLKEYYQDRLAGGDTPYPIPGLIYTVYLQDRHEALRRYQP